MFTKALLLGLFRGFAGCWPLPGGWVQPLIAGPIVGLILGDVKTGMICGGTLTLAWMGLVAIGGSVPPDKATGTVLGTAFAILTKSGVETALAVGVPAALLGQQLNILARTLCTGLMHKADSYAERGDFRGVAMMNWAGLIVYGILGFLPVFLAVYLGVDAVNAVVQAMPQKLINGLVIAGNMMPAVGFALLLRVIASKQLFYFLFAGFVLATFLKLSMIPVAILGICAGIAYTQLSSKSDGV